MWGECSTLVRAPIPDCSGRIMRICTMDAIPVSTQILSFQVGRALRQTCSSVLSLGHILHYLHSLSLALSRISPLHRVIGLGLQMGWQHKDCRYWDNLGESQPTPILSSLLPRSLNFLDLESEMRSAIWSFFKINLWAWSF